MNGWIIGGIIVGAWVVVLWIITRAINRTVDSGEGND